MIMSSSLSSDVVALTAHFVAKALPAVLLSRCWSCDRIASETPECSLSVNCLADAHVAVSMPRQDAAIRTENACHRRARSRILLAMAHAKHLAQTASSYTHTMRQCLAHSGSSCHMDHPSLGHLTGCSISVIPYRRSNGVIVASEYCAG
ncbi:hypothetical protein CONLIGDRAFT_142705 [Coniochaeta ligniaria NRRL 30616]|uniref:Uncharacterized protein n=1 Tax=Coniochaeta ligniaria NRRL 30616 TaxID=1408157 RepID=A0A1J7IPN6_9PEZI|nr:hypothetical protein CONLIGDRAFT_142705 [Coniochaeta ligniaria NRRL 30616]